MIYLSSCRSLIFAVQLFVISSSPSTLCAVLLEHFHLLTFDRLQICVHTWITNDNTTHTHVRAHTIFFYLSFSVSVCIYLYMCILSIHNTVLIYRCSRDSEYKHIYNMIYLLIIIIII